MQELTEAQFNRQVDRNLKGRELEKRGNIDAAIKLYELNIEEDFEGNFPYDRLAIIYRRQRKINEEIRVLEKAISVFNNLDRMDVPPKLEKFKLRIAKAKKDAELT